MKLGSFHGTTQRKKKEMKWNGNENNNNLKEDNSPKTLTQQKQKVNNLPCSKNKIIIQSTEHNNIMIKNNSY